MESRATQQRSWRRAGTPTTHEHIVEGSAKFAAPLVANLLHVCGLPLKLKALPLKFAAPLVANLLHACGRVAAALHGPQAAISSYRRCSCRAAAEGPREEGHDVFRV